MALRSLHKFWALNRRGLLDYFYPGVHFWQLLQYLILSLGNENSKYVVHGTRIGGHGTNVTGPMGPNLCLIHESGTLTLALPVWSVFDARISTSTVLLGLSGAILGIPCMEASKGKCYLQGPAIEWSSTSECIEYTLV
jgi:hypothetical protein